MITYRQNSKGGETLVYSRRRLMGYVKEATHCREKRKEIGNWYAEVQFVEERGWEAYDMAGKYLGFRLTRKEAAHLLASVVGQRMAEARRAVSLSAGNEAQAHFHAGPPGKREVDEG